MNDVDLDRIGTRTTLLLDEEFLGRDVEEKARIRRTQALQWVAIFIITALVGVLLYLQAQRGQDASSTAQRATTTAQRAQHAVAGKAPRAALARTDRQARQAKRQAVKVQQRLTTVTRTVHETREVLGLEGKRGATGRPGRDAVVGFTLADVLAGLSPLLTKAVNARIDEGLPDALSEACGGSCVGERGADGKDASAEQIDAAVARHCAPLNDCVSVVPGPKGDPGDPGAQGPKGDPGADGAPGPPPQPFTISFTDGTGVTHACTIDPNVGPAVTQSCS
jgi:hypothetical protein